MIYHKNGDSAYQFNDYTNGIVLRYNDRQYMFSSKKPIEWFCGGDYTTMCFSGTFYMLFNTSMRRIICGGNYGMCFATIYGLLK